MHRCSGHALDHADAGNNDPLGAHSFDHPIEQDAPVGQTDGFALRPGGEFYSRRPCEVPKIMALFDRPKVERFRGSPNRDKGYHAASGRKSVRSRSTNTMSPAPAEIKHIDRHMTRRPIDVINRFKQYCMQRNAIFLWRGPGRANAQSRRLIFGRPLLRAMQDTN